MSALINETNFDLSSQSKVDLKVVTDEGNKLEEDIEETCSTINSSYSICSGVWDATVNDYGDGNYTLRVRTVDEALNERNQTYQGSEVTVDNAKPDITGFDVDQRYATYDDSVEFSYNIIERSFSQERTVTNITNFRNNPDITGVNAQCNLASEQPEKRGVSNRTCEGIWNPSSLPDGNYTVNATSTDLAGNTRRNESNVNEWVFLDNEPPNITQVSINNTVIQAGRPIAVNVTVPGDDSKTLERVNVDGIVNLSYSGGSLWKGVTNSDQEDSFINVTAVDKAGNTDINESVNFEVDDEPPKLYQINISDRSIDPRDQEVTFTQNIFDENFVESKVNFTVTGDTDSGSFIRDIDETCDPQNSGNHTCKGTWNGTNKQNDPVVTDRYKLTVRAEDAAGQRSGKNSSAFKADKEDPRIFDQNTNVSYTNGSEIVGFNVTIDEFTFNESLVNISIEDQRGTYFSETDETCRNIEGTRYNCTSAVNFSERQAPKNYSFRTSVTDNAGNKNNAVEPSEWVVNDQTAPEIANLSLNDSYVSSGQKMNLTLDITDEDPIVPLVSKKAEGNTLQKIRDKNYTAEIEADASDEVVNVSVADKAGNSRSTSIGYIVDNEPPEIFSFNSNATDNVWWCVVYK
ncbi:hypothetical protein GLU26_02270 [Nanohaloarchaea archaeon]|nr:hypothetical protein [Candidatus Nanohaloarchaea archaeon]